MHPPSTAERERIPGDAMVFEAIGLRKEYQGAVALHGLDLQIDAGDVFCLLGANGAGKTTTIQLFLGFIEPTAGSARVLGHDMTRESVAARAGLAYIPENVMLYPHLTGLENLTFFTRLAGRDPGARALRTVLEEAGLQAAAIDRPVNTYSKGMRQKVGVAMAVAKEARALLLDEPTSGLDPRASNEFSQLLTRLRDQGVAILMATHDLFRAQEVGTRVGIMKHGQLVACRSTAELTPAELERIYLEHMHD